MLASPHETDCGLRASVLCSARINLRVHDIPTIRAATSVSQRKPFPNFWKWFGPRKSGVVKDPMQNSQNLFGDCLGDTLDPRLGSS